MQIDPLLAGMVAKLTTQLGDLAERVRAERFPPAIGDWQNRDVIDFIDRLRAETGDDYMGLAAAPCAAGTADFLIELGARCATLREAVETGTRLMGIATTAFTFDLAEDDSHAVISIRSAGPPREVLSTWVMLSWHKLLQWLIDTEIPLERAEFEHALDGLLTDHAAMFCGDCLFGGGANRLVFPRTYLDRRVVRLPHEGRRLKATTPGYFAEPGLLARSWSQLVRNAMRGELAKGHAPPSIVQLADDFGTSVETLRRRLRAEGSGYRAIKAEARLEVARHLMVDLNAGLGAASIGAGFSEPNALSRALKTGRGLRRRDLRIEVAPDDETRPGNDRKTKKA